MPWIVLTRITALARPPPSQQRTFRTLRFLSLSAERLTIAVHRHSIFVTAYQESDGASEGSALVEREYMSDLTRRAFATTTALATAASYSRIKGANDRIRMGYIGLGNRGDQVHDAFLEHGDQETVAVCDLR